MPDDRLPLDGPGPLVVSRKHYRNMQVIVRNDAEVAKLFDEAARRQGFEGWELEDE